MSTSRDIKDLPQTKEKAETKQDSSTEVNFVLEGPRQSCSFKGNRKLWKAFVRYSKREYGSVCHILEPIQLAILAAKVNLSTTLKKEPQPIIIQNLNVQRVVKRHRRVYGEMYVEYETEKEKCHYCWKKAIDEFLYVPHGKTYPLCQFHASALLATTTWKEKEE